LLVLAIPVALAILSSDPAASSTREVVARSQLKAFEEELRAFADDNGFYPGTNGLWDLVKPPHGTTNWHGPYIDNLPNDPIPKDPWGNEYIYECPGKHTASGYPYDLYSLGPPGSTNPVANWAERSWK
jgi:general secretion pathway protein G